MKFKVTIDFRKGPQFSCEVTASDSAAAEKAAIKVAADYGWDYSPKRVVALAVEDADAMAVL